jgi:lipopolysaccharide heptosyltransferase I
MAGRGRPPLARLEARNVALLKPSALGDIIHALPTLCALRRRFPSARFTWVVNRGYAPLLEGHPDLDDVLAFDRGAMKGGCLAGLLAYWRFARELRRRRFDLVIDLQGLLRSGLMALATGAARRVGLADAREGAGWCYTDRVAVPPGPRHAIDRCLLIARALGADDAPPAFRMPLRPDAAAWADAALAPLPRPWLVLAVGSRWLTKRWPPAHFAALAGRALAGGGSAVFVGSPEEGPLAQAVAAGLRAPTLDLSGRTSLPQLTAVLARADAVLANDTGPLHLAVALGRPVAAPYTCTKAALNGPYGGGAVETTVSCGGSYLRRCDRLVCFDELTPDRLWPTLQRALDAWPHRRSA